MNAAVRLKGSIFISVVAALVAVLLFAGSYALAVTGPAAQVGSGEPQSEAQQEIWGDVDCKNGVTTRDSQALLRKVLDQPPLSQEGDCPAIGTSVTVGGTPPTPIPTPTTGVGLSRANPVPAGQSHLVPEGWELTILDFTPNGTQEVLDENQFNDPPAPGKQFSIVRVRTKNISAGNPDDHDLTFALRMVGSENIGYSTFESSCGVIPDSFIFKPDDLFQGGSLDGNICYETAIGETDFTIFTNYFLSDDENVRWFEVE